MANKRDKSKSKQVRRAEKWAKERRNINWDLSKSLLGGLFTLAVSIVALYEATNYFRNDAETFYFIIFPILAGVASLGLLIQAFRKKNAIAYFWLAIALLLVTVAVIGRQSYIDTAKSKLIVLVAAFDGPEETFGLRKQIMEELHNAVKAYENTVLIDGGEIVTSGQGSEYARELGEKENADIVIWGWYQPTQNPNITIHVENLAVENFPIIGESATYQPSATIQDLELFEIQKSIGTEATNLLSVLVGYVSLESEDYQTALALFEKVLADRNSEIFVDRKDVVFLSAVCYQNLQNYEAAIKNYDEIIQQDQSNLLALTNRGAAYFLLGQKENAFRDFEKAIEFHPKLIDGYLARAFHFIWDKQHSLALEDYNKALELDPNNRVALINISSTHNSLGQYDLAIEIITKALELDPYDYQALNNRGGYYNNIGQYNKAIKDYNKAIQINSQIAVVYNNRGYSYDKLGNYLQAVKDYSKAIQLDSEDPSAYNNRGHAYYSLEQYERANDDFDKAIELNPNYATAYYNRGITYQLLGKNAEAEADFKKYEELTGQRP